MQPGPSARRDLGEEEIRVAADCSRLGLGERGVEPVTYGGESDVVADVPAGPVPVGAAERVEDPGQRPALPRSTTVVGVCEPDGCVEAAVAGDVGSRVV